MGLQQQAEAAVAETRKRQPAYELLAEQQAGFLVSWREQLRQFMAVNGRRNTQNASRAIATALGLNASIAYLSRSDDAAIDALPEDMRVVFLMHDLEGFKHREIAAGLDISAGTSKSRLHRARAWLRDYLTRHGLSVAMGDVS